MHQSNSIVHLDLSKSKLTASVIVSVVAIAILVALVYRRPSSAESESREEWVRAIGPENPNEYELGEWIPLSAIDPFGKFGRGSKSPGAGQVLLHCKECSSWSGPFQLLDSGNGAVAHAPSATLTHAAGCTVR